MHPDTPESFENRVLAGFASCGVPFESLLAGDAPLVAAVSGGADSLALLTACARLARQMGRGAILAVTIDHRIRPAKESAEDAAFVKAYCGSLAEAGYPAACVVRTLEEKAVAHCAKERGRGIEEAARFLRYRVFEETADAHNGSLVCLGHTKNDQLETILCRFLQGSGAGGIPRQRGRFVRPLLDISREEVEAYLAALGAGCRTDATNADTSYMRNRVRLLLMPQLDALFPGWQTALLMGAEKAADDAAAISGLADTAPWKLTAGGAAAEMDGQAFFALPRSARRDLAYRACALLGAQARFPYRLISRFIADRDEASGAVEKDGHAVTMGTDEITLEQKGGRVRVKKAARTGESGFCAIITEPGVYAFPFGSLRVSQTPVAGAIPVTLPVCVRSRLPEDAIQTAPGIHQNLNALFTNYGIPPGLRDTLPVVEDAAANGGPEIRFVYGEAAGFRNWKACAAPQNPAAWLLFF